MCRKLIVILFVGISLMISGCGKLGLYNSDRGAVLVSVADRNLYETDVAEFFKSAPGMSPEDSIQLCRNFIDEWIKTQVLQSYAVSDLSHRSASAMDIIENKVDQYRRQLILYDFENTYIDSQLDTVIAPAMISDYYRNNLSSFKLSSPLIKCAISRIPAGVRQSRKLENLFISKAEADQAEFLEICDKNGYLLVSYTENWVDVAEAAKLIPFSVNKADEIFTKRRFYDVEDENWRYMLRVDDYLPSGSIVPMEREINNIRKILLHERRHKLMTELEDSILKIAFRDGIVVDGTLK